MSYIEPAFRKAMPKSKYKFAHFDYMTNDWSCPYCGQPNYTGRPESIIQCSICLKESILTLPGWIKNVEQLLTNLHFLWKE